MQESKYQIKRWKVWKDTKRLLEETRDQTLSGVGAITYSDELPGSSNKTVLSKYNRLIEDAKKYDGIIQAYDVMINRLEKAITELLNEDERKIVLIYATYPNNSVKRENEALREGYARTTYYEWLNKSLTKLDGVLDPGKNLPRTYSVQNKQENEVK